MDKEDVLHIYTIEYYLVIKNEILPFSATCMDPEVIILNEVKSDRERQISHVNTYMWN